MAEIVNLEYKINFNNLQFIYFQGRNNEIDDIKKIDIPIINLTNTFNLIFLVNLHFIRINCYSYCVSYLIVIKVQSQLLKGQLHPLNPASAVAISKDQVHLLKLFAFI